MIRALPIECYAGPVAPDRRLPLMVWGQRRPACYQGSIGRRQVGKY
jgi:hypothetical protein